MSISNYLENQLLNTLRGTAFSSASVYLKLHTGDPGEDGVANAASNTTRNAVVFAPAASGSIASSSPVTWLNVPTAETVTHWSAWDAASAGNCLWTGALTSPAVLAAGDTFQITTLTLTLD